MTTAACPECGGPAKHIQRNSGAWYWTAEAAANVTDSVTAAPDVDVLAEILIEAENDDQMGVEYRPERPAPAKYTRLMREGQP